MSENECTHDCSSCGASCSSRQNVIEKEKLNDKSHVKKVIAVVSGKGGVGKSLVTGLLACAAQRAGLRTAIMDADVTGPSIPKMFTFTTQSIAVEEDQLVPAETATGIKAISVNLLLEDETTPVVWRGPVISGVIKQFWSEVNWGDNDIMFIDMPPGTGDVPLTVFQSLPINGIVIVTSPQELVGMVVQKAVNMANMMNVPILGVVENMSYITCPDCGKRINLYGESRIKEAAALAGTDNTACIPIDPAVATACDRGLIETCDGDWLTDFAKKIIG